MIPTAKGQRKDYVWVAQAQSRRNDVRKVYTWNVGQMLPQGKYKDADVNRCDICGIPCTEVLYGFRCYGRPKRILGERLREHGTRRLHPLVSYVTLECGYGLTQRQHRDLMWHTNSIEYLSGARLTMRKYSLSLTRSVYECFYKHAAQHALLAGRALSLVSLVCTG